jgi:hypothetical protein
MKQFCLFVLILFSSYAYAQRVSMKSDEVTLERNSCTIGFLNGGGSLIGCDIELLLGEKMGFQVGGGLIGYGVGINYHFKPSIRSSFLSLQYRSIGFGNYFALSSIGPNIVYRSEKWFTCQFGIGGVVDVGPLYPANKTRPDAVLTISIGGYFPF